MIVRILIADDHKIIVDGLRSLLEKDSALKVIGQASDGLTTVRLAADLSPDLVIMDISMPGLNGIDATRRILEAQSPGEDHRPVHAQGRPLHRRGAQERSDGLPAERIGFR